MEGVDDADPPQFVYAALLLPGDSNFTPLASSLATNILKNIIYIYIGTYIYQFSSCIIAYLCLVPLSIISVKV